MLSKLKNYLRSHTKYGKSRYLNFLFQYDMRRYFRYSSMDRNSDEVQIETEIRLLIHSIEKALSLPAARPGFGREKIEALLQGYDNYCKLQNCKNAKEIDALVFGTIHAYIAFQKACCPEFDLEFIPPRFRDVQANGCAGVSSDSLCDFSNLTFSDFAMSRHSLRYYGSLPIQIETIKKAVSLAQTAPSACNRQPTHIYACVNTEKIDTIMAFHGGMKGFGRPQAILAVTGALGAYTSEYERNTVHVDCGLFAMNLLYALHYYGLATCPIIWGSEPDNDKRIRKILDIPECETVALLITVGSYPADSYRFAKAQRKETNTVFDVIN